MLSKGTVIFKKLLNIKKRHRSQNKIKRNKLENFPKSNWCSRVVEYECSCRFNGIFGFLLFSIFQRLHIHLQYFITAWGFYFMWLSFFFFFSKSLWGNIFSCNQKYIHMCVCVCVCVYIYIYIIYFWVSLFSQYSLVYTWVL